MNNRRKGIKYAKNPRTYRITATLNKEEYEKIVGMADELQTTMTDVVLQGAELLEAKLKKN